MNENFISNQIKCPGVVDKNSVKILLNFKNSTLERIQKFCKKCFISQKDFINNLISEHIEYMVSNIECKSDELISQYFRLSTLFDGKTKKHVMKDEIPVEKCQNIKIEISPVIKHGIAQICEIIPWDQKEFLEHAIEYQLNHLILEIKNNNFSVLEKFCNFSEKIDDLKKVLMSMISNLK